MNIIQVCAMYIARFLLSSIFLISAVHEMADWGTTEQYFLMVTTRWMNTLQADAFMGSFLGEMMPWLPWVLLLAIIFKLVGSFLLILGCSVRLGATLLILFLIPATLIVHGFWNLPLQERAIEMVMFMKNVSILGGLLLVLAVGKGTSSSKSA